MLRCMGNAAGIRVASGKANHNKARAVVHFETLTQQSFLFYFTVSVYYWLCWEPEGPLGAVAELDSSSQLDNMWKSHIWPSGLQI